MTLAFVALLASSSAMRYLIAIASVAAIIACMCLSKGQQSKAEQQAKLRAELLPHMMAGDSEAALKNNGVEMSKFMAAHPEIFAHSQTSTSTVSSVATPR